MANYGKGVVLRVLRGEQLVQIINRVNANASPSEVTVYKRAVEVQNGNGPANMIQYQLQNNLKERIENFISNARKESEMVKGTKLFR